MAILEIAYENPPEDMPILRVLQGDMPRTDQERLREQINNQYRDLKRQGQGTFRFGKYPEMTFRVVPNPKNERDPSIILMVDRPSVALGREPRDLGGLKLGDPSLEDAILKYIEQHYRMAEQDGIPSDILALVGYIVVRMSKAADDPDARSALVLPLRALGRRHPALSSVADLMGQRTQPEGRNDWWLPRVFDSLFFRR